MIFFPTAEHLFTWLSIFWLAISGNQNPTMIQLSFLAQWPAKSPVAFPKRRLANL
jgi:hypothetical protein